MKNEFTRNQLSEFNKKGYTSVAARFAKSAEQMLEELEHKKPCMLRILSEAGHFELWVDDIDKGVKIQKWLSVKLQEVVDVYTI